MVGVHGNLGLRASGWRMRLSIDDLRELENRCGSHKLL